MTAVALSASGEATGDGDRRTRKVAILIWEGTEILDWAGPTEVFETAGRLGARGDAAAFEVYTVSRTTEPVTSQRCVRVVPRFSIADAPAPDVVVLPGGGTDTVLEDPEFVRWVGRVAGEAEVALSVCTGAFLLGKAGLLDGKDVTTWYGETDLLAAEFPEARVHEGRRFIDNGQIVTTAGVSAGIDGALHVVARLLGRDLAERTAAHMEYRWAPEPYLTKNYRATVD
jgi:transcriptional regulator GlxA family with amidase domain